MGNLPSSKDLLRVKLHLQLPESLNPAIPYHSGQYQMTPETQVTPTPKNDRSSGFVRENHKKSLLPDVPCSTFLDLSFSLTNLLAYVTKSKHFESAKSFHSLTSAWRDELANQCLKRHCILFAPCAVIQ